MSYSWLPVALVGATIGWVVVAAITYGALKSRRGWWKGEGIQ